MKIEEKYYVRSIESSIYKEWILKKHYAKRMPCVEYAFGLYDKENIIHGVITYGTPVSSNLRNSFNNYNLIELNRLIKDDLMEKNVTSFFVSKSLKMLPSPLVIVSYADTSMNHHGYIYQATNFIYTGLSVKFSDYMVEGMEHLHNSTVMDMSRGKENRVAWLREKFGDKLYMKERDRKHRYFYFIGNKREKKEMLSSIPYKIEKYPKGENINYDASYLPTIQKELF